MPAQIHLKIDGRNIPEEMSDSLISVEVDQSLHFPDMFSIHLRDDLDAGRDALKWADSDDFALGKSVEIAIETDEDPDLFEAERETLIKGEITSVEPEFWGEGVPTLLVRGYDKSHRLHRGTHIRSFVQKSDSDIASDIAGECGLQPQVDSSGEVHQHVLQDNQTNMEFLQERARRIGYFVYVRDGKLHFRRTPQVTFSAGEKELRWGRDLRDFQIRLTAVEQVSGVNVRGWDPKQKEAITSQKADARDTPKVGERSSGAKAAERAFGRSEGFVTDRPLTTSKEADYLAQSVCDETGNSFIQAEGTCRQGSPRVAAGAWIKLSDIGKRFSGRYLVTRAIHRYEHGDYEVRFEVSGRRANTLGQLLATGNGSRYGVVVGIVTNNSDPDGLGRVKLKYPSLSDGVESDWARLVSPGAGASRGFEFIPEVNDEVLVAFEYNDVNRPFVLGGLWNGKDEPPEKGSNIISGGKVQKRIIRSLSGHTIILDDSDGGPKISIVDKTEGNLIEIDSQNNAVEVKAGKKIEIHTDDGHTVVLDSSGITIEAAAGKDITLKGNNVKIDATMGVDVKASGTVKIEGMSTTVKGSASMELDGGATLTAKGGVVMIN